MAGRLRTSSMAGGRPRLNSQHSPSLSPSASPEDEAKLYAFMSEEVDTLAFKLKRGEVSGSTRTGLLTVDLLLHAVQRGQFRDVAQVLATLRAIGRRLVRSRPIELTVGNVVRQALFTVRQENITYMRAEAEDPGMGLAENRPNELDEEADEEDSQSDDGAQVDPLDPLSFHQFGEGLHSQDPLMPLALTRSASSFPMSQDEKEELLEATADTGLSLHKLLDADDELHGREDTPFCEELKGAVIEELEQLQASIEHAHEDIKRKANQYIHARERILVFGFSRTVIAFLKEVSKFRKFEVFVSESAPSFAGHRMAVELARLGVETVAISDAAVFSVMSRVNKVVAAPHAVLANGGVIAHAGFHNVALAAKAHSVPVVAVTGLHKLCPLYAFDQDTFNAHGPPSEVLKFEDDFPYERVVVNNPSYCYVEPDLISIFVTNYGGHSPSYVYRLLADRYDQRDYHL